MTSKTKLPAKAPHFKEGHITTFAVTLVSGLISAAALSYHIYRDAQIDHEPVKMAFVILAGLFAFGMAMSPISLARAHGEAMEGGNAQTGLLIIAIMMMVVDGALQVHAAVFIMETFGAKPPGYWVLGIGAGMFQLGFFFVRGNLYAAHTEIQSLIDARAHEREMARESRRSKLEAEATALGIIFDGRTSDSILQGKIHQRRMHVAA